MKIHSHYKTKNNGERKIRICQECESLFLPYLIKLKPSNYLQMVNGEEGKLRHLTVLSNALYLRFVIVLILMLNRSQDCNKYSIFSGCFIILFVAILLLEKFGAVKKG